MKPVFLSVHVTVSTMRIEKKVLWLYLTLADGEEENIWQSSTIQNDIFTKKTTEKIWLIKNKRYRAS